MSADLELVEGVHGWFLGESDDLITRQIHDFGAHTRPEVAMVTSLVAPGDIVLDVGAHIGTFAVPLALAATSAGRVYAFEPFPPTFELLRRNLVLNGVANWVSAIPAAASDTEQSLHAVSDAVANNTGATHLSDSGDGVDLPTVVLDAWWASVGRPTIRLAKIDVEGMEMAVLRGARELLDACVPALYLEVADVQLRRAGVSGGSTELETLLRDRGYRCFRNSGSRNARADRYQPAEVTSFADQGELFDVLALHESDERVARLAAAMAE